MIVLREGETVWLMFSYCGCTLEVKLNVEWPMALLAKKINLDIMDKIVMLATLYQIKYLKSYNKHICVLAKYLSFMIKKILVIDLKIQLDNVCYYQSTINFKQLVKKNSD